MAKKNDEAWVLHRSLRRAEEKINELEAEKAKLTRELANVFIVLGVTDFAQGEENATSGRGNVVEWER